MPTLDDLPAIATLPAIQANDLFPISESSTGCSRVRAVPAALVAQGFTHAWRVDYNHPSLATAGANTTDVTLNLLLLPAYSIVEKVRAVVVEAFTVTDLEIFVGFTGTTQGFLSTFDASAKAVFQNTAAAIDTQLEVHATGATANQYLTVTFDPNSAHLHDLGAGSVVILASITQIADYASIVPATTAAL